MSLPQILRILWAHRLSLAAMAFTGITLAALATWWLPKTYQATSEVYIDLGATNAVSGGNAPHAALAALVGTQADVIASVRVAEAVVTDLNLRIDPYWTQRWQAELAGQGDPVNGIAQLLLEDLQVQTDAVGSLVRVSMQADSGQRAAVLANAFVSAYMRIALALRANPARANAEFFASGSEKALARLARAKARLSAYQRDNGVLEVDQRFDVESERLSKLTAQLAELQGDSARARARVQQGDGSTVLPEVLADPVVQRLREKLASAQAEFSRLAQRLGTAHPQYLAQQSEVASLRRQLRIENARSRAGVRAAGAVSAERVLELERALAEQRQKVLALKDKRDQIDLLRSEVVASQTAYDLVVERSAVANLESQLQQTNASVLTKATVPVKAVSPKPKLNLALGGLLGLLLGAAFALAAESSRPMVRGLDDIDAHLELRVLANLPSSGRARKRSGRSRGLNELPVISALPRLPGLSGKGSA